MTHDDETVATGTDTTLTFTPLDDGTYEITVTATDNNDGSSTATTTLTVTNVAPTVTVVEDLEGPVYSNGVAPKGDTAAKARPSASATLSVQNDVPLEKSDNQAQPVSAPNHLGSTTPSAGIWWTVVAVLIAAMMGWALVALSTRHDSA